MSGRHGVVLPLPPERLGPGSRSATGRGFVSLVGAGPGDPDLVTVRGLRRLREADAVVFDRLAPRELLGEAPPEASRIYCGKSSGDQVMPQEEINSLLVALARSGRRVVRLKGGDPFVFGRGGEEAAALEAAGVPWEVVPGLTSAVSVPALAGIPLTQRGVASSFTVASARGAGGEPVSGERWAREETLVLLMGVSRLGPFTRELIDGGRDPDTPAAVVERGSLPGERVIVGTVADVAERAREAGVRPPAVLVVGDVVRLREDLAAAATEDVPARNDRLGSAAEPAREETRRHEIGMEGAGS